MLETRVITGRGLFIVPPNDNYRHFYLYTNVIRRPRVNWTNSKYNPDKSEYAKITWVRNDYVLKDEAVNYEAQLFEYSVDITGYLCNGIVCGFNGISSYLDYICVQLGIPPLEPGEGDPIFTQPLTNAPDMVKIVCRGDTGLVCKLYYLEYDNNCQQTSPSPKPPPDPPIEPPIFDETPIDGVSPPYYPPNDDSDTLPYPGDSFPPDPPPVGTPLWTVVTTERTLTIVSPDAPVTFSNFRCTSVRGLQAVGHNGDNQLTQYCGEFSNYCLNEGETVVSVTPTGEYCEEDYP